MSNNPFIASTTSSLQIRDLSSVTTTGTQNLDMVRVLFEYLFTTKHTLKDQNKSLMLYLQEYVNKNNTETINRILSDNAVIDLDPSLLKSMLILTEHVAGSEQSRTKVFEIFNNKMQAF